MGISPPRSQAPGLNVMHHAALLVLVTQLTTATAQSWLKQFPPASPPARDTHGMTYEPFSQRVVLCGGFNVLVGHSSDTWEWNGLTWTQTAQGAAPMGRETFGFCADGTGGVIMFGGYTAIPAGPPGRVFNDTWRYSQGTWTQMAPAQSPSPRRWPAMTLTNNGVVMFGGSDRNLVAVLGDTWRWSGANWVQLSPTASPQARWGHWMTFDSARNMAVMFGGMQASPSPRLDDTWEFDGANWVERTPLHRPSARTEATMVYDSHRSRTVLFGGQDGPLNRFDDTWEWDGLDWSQSITVNTPSPRDSVGMAFDITSQQVVMFGGYGASGSSTSSLGDTFLYAPIATPAAYSPFGNACAGTTGLPHFAPLPGELPRLGTTSRLRLSGLAQSVLVPIFVLGFSDAQNSGPHGSYSLPFELTPFGFPGCWQFVSDDSTRFVLALNGQADWAINIPALSGLVGFEFFVQALVNDGISPSISLSNAVRGTIGY
jgi:hypothetical protein